MRIYAAMFLIIIFSMSVFALLTHSGNKNSTETKASKHGIFLHK